jgi:hypothetical protein
MQKGAVKRTIPQATPLTSSNPAACQFLCLNPKSNFKFFAYPSLRAKGSGDAAGCISCSFTVNLFSFIFVSMTGSGA